MFEQFRNNAAAQHATKLGLSAGALALGVGFVAFPRFFAPSPASRAACIDNISQETAGTHVNGLLPDGCGDFVSLFDKIDHPEDPAQLEYVIPDLETFKTASQDIINDQTRLKIFGALGVALVVGFARGHDTYHVDKSRLQLDNL